MYICLRHKMKKRETGVLGGLCGRSRDQKFEDTNIFRIPLSVRKNIFYFIVALPLDSPIRRWDRRCRVCSEAHSGVVPRSPCPKLIESHSDQASPRVSVSATSTVCDSNPATEYWLTVSRILDVRVRVSLKPDRVGIKSTYPSSFGTSVSNVVPRRGYAYTIHRNAYFLRAANFVVLIPIYSLCG